LKFRTATKADAALIVNLGLRTFNQAFREMNNPADFNAYIAHAFAADTISAELRDQRSLFVLVFSGETLAGYYKLYRGPAPECVANRPAMEIVRFYTLKKFWGLGVGGSMMENCLELAREKEAAAVWLSSWKKNNRGNAFYRKWGFEIAGEKTFTIGKDIQEDYILVRQLYTIQAEPVDCEGV